MYGTIHYIYAMIFFVYQVQKGHYMYPIYKYHLVLSIIVRRHAYMCLIYVMNDFIACGIFTQTGK
jgi:hypothetical protein